MEKSWHVITALLLLFMLTELVGLIVVYNYIDWDLSKTSGKTEFRLLELSGVTLERPQVEENTSWVYMVIAVLFGTLILLGIIKLGWTALWRYWFFFAIIICLALSLAAFMNSGLALVAAILLAYFKVFKPNLLAQNLSEVFLYGGIAAIFVPIMNLWAAGSLLLVISLYDMYAVWKSKHMVTLAVFQSQQKIFAGLSIPYHTDKKKVSSIIHSHVTKHSASTIIPQGKRIKGKPLALPNPPAYQSARMAIVGGGDVGFPLIFAGTILKLTGTFWHAAFIIPFVGFSLGLLFIFGEKNKFYPAMPFLSAGCFIGYGILQLLI